MLELSETTAIYLAFALLAIASWKIIRCERNDGGSVYPPSPSKRHWLWKHGVAFVGDGVTSHDEIMFQWMRKLNSKVVSFELPVAGRVITVGDAEVAKYVLQGKTKDGKLGNLFPKASILYNAFIPVIGKKSLIVMDGKEWARQRRLFHPAFSSAQLQGMITTFVHKCDRFFEFIDKDDIANDQSTRMFDRGADLTSDIIAQVAFGEDWGAVWGSSELNKGAATLAAVRTLSDLIGIEVKDPIQSLNPFFQRKISRLKAVLDEDMKALVRRRINIIRSEQKDEEKKDILSLTLSNFLEANGESISISDEDMIYIISQLKTFYLAGHHTTATTVSWAYWLITSNLKVLERARSEVLEHFGKDWVDAVMKGDNYKHIIPEESNTYENLQKCEYLDAVIHETLRLYPPATTVRYQPDRAAKFGKHKLGNGSIVHLNIYAIHRDVDIWGQDAEEFRPERFLGEEGGKNMKSFGYLPFSKGLRSCIGRYLAFLEIRIVLAALITRYDGTAIDAQILNMAKNGGKVKLSRRSEAEKSVRMTA